MSSKYISLVADALGQAVDIQITKPEFAEASKYCEKLKFQTSVLFGDDNGYNLHEKLYAEVEQYFKQKAEGEAYEILRLMLTRRAEEQSAAIVPAPKIKRSKKTK